MGRLAKRFKAESISDERCATIFLSTTFVSVFVSFANTLELNCAERLSFLSDTGEESAGMFLVTPREYTCAKLGTIMEITSGNHEKSPNF